MLHFLPPRCQFSPGRAASRCATVTALSLPCGLCSCCSWRRRALRRCLSPSTPIKTCGFSYCYSLVVSFSLCPFLVLAVLVRDILSSPTPTAGLGSAKDQFNPSLLAPLLRCDVEQDARQGKRSYLALAVIILPLLNGNAFGRVFSIQLP